ncbi:IQ domain-containing protein IQM3 isoform X1 [Prunus yedoensis var. nudiflora]|uniref:IQ domain-containing protein IQM3 isoform X1 n=1 Tax=Prunus yedoensis var. nudiflora TaxID=2094558 RepID=A0A314XYH1_PRUYE|nr:IQ domain-containing protein IQM3 isoform X1 [Prunus yedoensis var. nudiflora]
MEVETQTQTLLTFDKPPFSSFSPNDLGSRDFRGSEMAAVDPNATPHATKLADTAVVAEEYWWQAIDSWRLNRTTISFFDNNTTESWTSKWNRVGKNASKVGKGLSKDAKAQKLAFQHWIEAIDPRHRYGHSLHVYYEEWSKADAGQPFFYWLDVGDGKELDLKECHRSKLRNNASNILDLKRGCIMNMMLLKG